MGRKKVYVVNHARHDFSAAESYGPLVYISEGMVNRFDVSHMARLAEDAFSDASEEDYILLTSLTNMCSIVCAVFAAKFNRLNLLMWKGTGYVERTLIFEVVDQQEE